MIASTAAVALYIFFFKNSYIIKLSLRLELDVEQQNEDDHHILALARIFLLEKRMEKSHVKFIHTNANFDTYWLTLFC